MTAQGWCVSSLGSGGKPAEELPRTLKARRGSLWLVLNHLGVGRFESSDSISDIYLAAPHGMW